MGRALRSGLFFTIAIGLPASPLFAQSPQPGVRVVIHDSASVGEAMLAEARELSVSVFRAAGLETDVVAGGAPCAAAAPRFCVMVLLRPRHPQFEPGKVRTMGVALAADQHRAVVTLYFDAVVDVARRYGQPVGKVLGVALAHEIGHVLLPPPSHSEIGIMQPSWEGDTLRHAVSGAVTFTDEQAAIIRERLMGRKVMP